MRLASGSASVDLNLGEPVTHNTAEPQPFTRSVQLQQFGSPLPGLNQLPQDDSGIHYSAPGQTVRISFGGSKPKSEVQVSPFARSNTVENPRPPRGASQGGNGGGLVNAITFKPAKPTTQQEEEDVFTTPTSPTITTTATTIAEADTTTDPTTTTTTTISPSRPHTKIRFRPIPKRPFAPSFPPLAKEGIRHLGKVSLRPNFFKSQNSEIEDIPATDSTQANEEEATPVSEGEAEESTTEAAPVLGGVPSTTDSTTTTTTVTSTSSSTTSSSTRSNGGFVFPKRRNVTLPFGTRLARRRRPLLTNKSSAQQTNPNHTSIPRPSPASTTTASQQKPRPRPRPSTHSHTDSTTNKNPHPAPQHQSRAPRTAFANIPPPVLSPSGIPLVVVPVSAPSTPAPKDPPLLPSRSLLPPPVFSKPRPPPSLRLQPLFALQELRGSNQDESLPEEREVEVSHTPPLDTGRNEAPLILQSLQSSLKGGIHRSGPLNMSDSPWVPLYPATTTTRPDRQSQIPQFTHSKSFPQPISSSRSSSSKAFPKAPKRSPGKDSEEDAIREAMIELQRLN
ncbi:hypothetical protein E2C01_011330 [Portunus trituberculatus]|uniref:Uncharacterized protein n=1 Tax=Portunus trituberculatus TaxID=210409 RepID=A0A5B7DBE4_PORTR|nr:hypothetical protein [Portunus trituberculatus]